MKKPRVKNKHRKAEQKACIDSETAEIESLKTKYESLDIEKVTTFDDLPLCARTRKGLAQHGFLAPTDIQKQAIPLALREQDILGAAKTGSGKTIAFIIPLLELLYRQRWSRNDGLGALVITPTRELAYQIFSVLNRVGEAHEFSAGLIIGGKDLKFERKRMDQVNIVICTPGRLLQHMDENPLFNTDNLQMLILDEADRCLDLGFSKAMNAIIEHLPTERQTLLFSATQTKSVSDLVRLSLRDPSYVSVHEQATYSTPAALTQSYIVCEQQDKLDTLWSFIKHHKQHKILVFVHTCKQVKFMYESFCRMRPGITVMALYGTLHQMRRMAVYDDFCSKQRAVLLATDIAARGLDFPSVHWVVQLDCPEDVDTYIHRAGRTARYERYGEALLVLTRFEQEKMLPLLRQRKIPIDEIEVNKLKTSTVQRKLEALLARDVNLKETAKRAYKAYFKSVFLMKNKAVFDVSSIDVEAFARSLGLAVAPRIRFLKRKSALKAADGAAAAAEEQTEEIVLGPGQADQMDEWRPLFRTSYRFHDDDNNSDATRRPADDSDSSDGGLLRVKQRPVSPTSELSADDSTVADGNAIADGSTVADGNAIAEKSGRGKIVSRAAVAKRALKKQILPNTRIEFNEDGQAVLDASRQQVSQLAQEYQLERATGGIDIERARQVLRQEDVVDRQLYRDKIRAKHREKKRKLKQQMANSDEDGSDIEVRLASPPESGEDGRIASAGEDDDDRVASASDDDDDRVASASDDDDDRVASAGEDDDDRVSSAGEKSAPEDTAEVACSSDSSDDGHTTSVSVPPPLKRRQVSVRAISGKRRRSSPRDDGSAQQQLQGSMVQDEELALRLLQS